MKIDISVGALDPVGTPNFYDNLSNVLDVWKYDGQRIIPEFFGEREKVEDEHEADGPLGRGTKNVQWVTLETHEMGMIPNIYTDQQPPGCVLISGRYSWLQNQICIIILAHETL